MLRLLQDSTEVQLGPLASTWACCPGQFILGVACAVAGLAGYVYRQKTGKVQTKLGTVTMFGLILLGAYLMGATEIFTDVVDKIMGAVRGT